MIKHTQRPWLNPAIVALSLVIISTDAMTPRGTADYIFYFIPVAMGILHTRPEAPLFTALLCSLLSILGYFLSPLNPSALSSHLPLLNRSFTIITLWVVAFLVRAIIQSRNQVERNGRLMRGQTKLAELMRGELTVKEVSLSILDFFAESFNAKVGSIYMRQESSKSMNFIAGHAVLTERIVPSYRLGEGLVGQVARDKKIHKLNQLPENYLKVSSSLGDGPAKNLILAPLIADSDVIAVLELGNYDDPHDVLSELLGFVSESCAIALRSAAHKSKLTELLHHSQQQAEELQAQQEELRVVNEELEQQTRALKESHIRLENQQAELEQSNQQLEEQTQTLEHQKSLLDERNQDLLKAQFSLEEKAREVMRSSQYKSEFLANMSHELRTPLNSTLILAKLLSENKPGNLNNEQVKYADIIYNSGNDLLNLINDILDLSKVEAGKMVVTPEVVTLAQVLKSMENNFLALARDKGIAFSIHTMPDVPVEIITDKMRLEQILKNFLSNAFKFTSKGSVKLEVSSENQEISFSVIDTGVGIPEDQQEVIFEAFRQADGTTNRKYGGTGLGLSISKELSKILGGVISVESQKDRGSRFTLTIPLKLETDQIRSSRVEIKTPQNPIALPQKIRPREETIKFSFHDDRDKINEFKRKILIVEDDENFAKILMDLARENGFGVMVSPTADEGLRLAKTLSPHAVILDVRLPDHSGMMVLDQLKTDAKTRHIPVHVISNEDFTKSALEMGAVGYMLKPVKKEMLLGAFENLLQHMDQKLKRVLVVEDDEVQREHIIRLIADNNVEVDSTNNSMNALKKLSEKTYDCMIMDLSLPDLSGFDLLGRLSRDNDTYSYPPVIVYTARDLTPEEEERLRLYSKSIIIKGAKSPERLLSEVTLFLHRVETDLPAERQRMLKELRSRESSLGNRKILVVDDDVRNIFALTSALEGHNAQVTVARNGIEALEQMENHDDIDLVLMDVMMPEMDGFEAMRRIRAEKKWKDRPIIALTAKAMKDDRVKCLEAGADDYLSKPLNIERLMSLIRVWLPQKRSFAP